MVGAIYQLVHVMFPNDPSYFRGHDVPVLERGVKVVSVLLAVNTIAAFSVAVSRGATCAFDTQESSRHIRM